MIQTRNEALAVLRAAITDASTVRKKLEQNKPASDGIVALGAEEVDDLIAQQSAVLTQLTQLVDYLHKEQT